VTDRTQLEAVTRNTQGAVLDDLASTRWLDAFADRLAAAPSPCIVTELIERLDELRRRLPLEVWRDAAAALRQHRIATLLDEDPYTRRARQKPRGYAGDAVMLDFVYEGTADDLSPVGRAVFAATTGSRSGDAVRERRRRLAALVDDVASTTELPTILALASGHARELDVSVAVRDGRVGRWLCIDQDGESLRVIRARLARATVAWAGVETVVGSVRQILGGGLTLPPADLVYAAGLFDYLDDRVATALLGRLVGACKPGGRVLIANFANDSTDRAYMESFMDWWLLYRGEDDLLRLAEATRLPVVARTFRDDSRRAIYLELSKR
jgi:extracellular factor (EF) 3-hydroxypalmitic acid methyl ester biosynthesis protein